jgi:hypothetical protein
MDTSGKIIGFASKFYTLWHWRTETRYFTDSYGNHWPYTKSTYYIYIKNISTNLARVNKLYPDLSIDEGLRGKTRSFSIENKEDLSPEILKFGKYYGKSIYDIEKTDFNYVLWLRDNTHSFRLRDIINGLDSVKKLDEDKENEILERFDNIRKSFLTEGEYTVSFERNPGNCLSGLPWKIKLDDNCPKSIIDWIDDYKKYDNGCSVFPFPGQRVTANGTINGNTYLIVFEDYKQVNGMYPYKMGMINGKYSKTKNKEFTTKLTPVGFTYMDNENEPYFQILKIS